MTLFNQEFFKKWKERLAIFVVAMAMLAGSMGFVSEAVYGADGESSATLILEAAGILSADSTGSYSLGAPLTREQFAKMLVMASSYKNQVAASAYSSPFKDVSAGNWSTPYIKLAASGGLLSGYSDGSFRPGGSVTLEQGVNSVLLLLGYSQSDFVGAFPYIQMSMYESLGLSTGISGSIGTLMTRGDAAQLLYNALGTEKKDSSQTLAESLGYSLNANGEVDYAAVVSGNMDGPYTVKSDSWDSDLGISSGATVYKNGSKVSLSDVNNYDIVYYSSAKTTVWAYDDRITGIYEAAAPSQDTVTSVTVSGSVYSLESTNAYAALSSSGSLKIGEPITLLLGRNGGVADAVSISGLNQATVLYITEASSNSVKGVTAEGMTLSYSTSNTSWVEPGDVLKISFSSSGKMTIGRAASGSLSGVADEGLMTIGTTKIAENAAILDTNQGNYVVSSMSRLDGVSLSKEKVLYSRSENGAVTALILDNVTGDTMEYGVVTSASSNSNGTNVSGSYSYDIGGVSHSLNTQSKAFSSLHQGAAMFYGESGAVSTIKNLTKLSGKVADFNSAAVTVSSGTGSSGEYPLYANVAVYKKEGFTYTYESLEKALAAYEAGAALTFYYDKAPANGGRIRVIIY